jgi:hypothetical protein
VSNVDRQPNGKYRAGYREVHGGPQKTKTFAGKTVAMASLKQVEHHSGVNPASVAEPLGHDVATLLRTYAHDLPRDDDRMRVLVDQALASCQGRDEAGSL